MTDVPSRYPVAAEYAHSFRRNLLRSERTYRLGPQGMEWHDGKTVRLVRYGDIVEVHEYKSKVWGPLSARIPRRLDYVLHCRDGRKIVLNSTHRVSFRGLEDRSASCATLVGELNKRVTAANPGVKAFKKLHWSYRLDLAADRVRHGLGLLFWKLIRCIDFDRAANAAAWVMRKVGPLLRGHRTARANLTAAYPDKSSAEIEHILTGMWDNLGRLAVEYANLDRLIDADDPNAGRIVAAPGTLERFLRLRDDGKPALLFTAHLANYEVGAIAGAQRGLGMAVLYRRPNFGPLADQLVRMRSASMGRIISADANSVWRIKEALGDGLHVAMLIDQHFHNGADVTFFGRPCKVNPMPGLFARRIDCPVHGVRSVRLPGNRIQLELTEELELPRDGEGKIDIQAAMQVMTTLIESWIREHPAQWPWLQRRWR
jgi:Kdo2-lipid IVA lauroyltransferase/acyltransferase